jgi:hypothetical protein
MTITLNGSAGVTTSTGAVYDGLQTATAVTASGTSVDFTNIPSWVKRVTLMLSGVSTNGTSLLIAQVGTSSGVTTSGYGGNYYNNNSVYSTASNGFVVSSTNTTTASVVRYGVYTLVNITGNTWLITGVMSDAAAAAALSGYIALSGTLDRVRITTAGGTDALDAGSINIIYE